MDANNSLQEHHNNRLITSSAVENNELLQFIKFQSIEYQKLQRAHQILVKKLRDSQASIVRLQQALCHYGLVDARSAAQDFDVLNTSKTTTRRQSNIGPPQSPTDHHMDQVKLNKSQLKSTSRELGFSTPALRIAARAEYCSDLEPRCTNLEWKEPMGIEAKSAQTIIRGNSRKELVSHSATPDDIAPFDDKPSVHIEPHQRPAKRRRLYTPSHLHSQNYEGFPNSYEIRTQSRIQGIKPQVEAIGDGFDAHGVPDFVPVLETNGDWKSNQTDLVQDAVQSSTRAYRVPGDVPPNVSHSTVEHTGIRFLTSLQLHGVHQSLRERARSPPGYWRTDMPLSPDDRLEG